MRLEGRIALVTGGAGGIGAATCRRLAAEGATVAVTDLKADAAGEVAAEIGGRAYELDVSSTESVIAAVAATESDLGPIDVLVNNAGYDEFGFFVNTDEAMWDRVVGVNLRGVIACTHAVLPGMQERRRGRIVNVASEAGRVGSPGSGVYSAAKAGVIGLTKALAKEVARHGVYVNAISPAVIETAILDQLTPAQVEYMVQRIPLGRTGRPEEVAALICWLASDECTFTTGQCIDISGGRATY